MSFQNYQYQFPPNKRAAKVSIRAQINKALEEVEELEAAYIGGESLERVAEELHDALFALEGVRRKLGGRLSDSAYVYVLNKARARGDIR